MTISLDDNKVVIQRNGHPEEPKAEEGSPGNGGEIYEGQIISKKNL